MVTIRGRCEDREPGPTFGQSDHELRSQDWPSNIRHAKTLWASDFLQVQTMTTKGMIDLFVLFFIHPQSKRAIISGITANPD
jgi:hypothetical protein